MAGLCWMTVILTVFLSPANGLEQNYQDRLPALVDDILNRYGGPGMFSVAVKVPGNLNQQVFSDDPDNTVRNTINNNDVYTGNRVVAAKPVQGDHAESRVLDNLNGLFNGHAQTDWFLFYVYASPCTYICLNPTHNRRILNRMNLITQWGTNKYAFVFSKVHRPNSEPPITDAETRNAIQRLGDAIGLNNIFHCDGPQDRVQCNSCDNNGQVATNCYIN